MRNRCERQDVSFLVPWSTCLWTEEQCKTTWFHKHKTGNRTITTGYMVGNLRDAKGTIGNLFNLGPRFETWRARWRSDKLQKCVNRQEFYPNLWEFLSFHHGFATFSDFFTMSWCLGNFHPFSLCFWPWFIISHCQQLSFTPTCTPQASGIWTGAHTFCRPPKTSRPAKGSPRLWWSMDWTSIDQQ